MYLQLGSVCEGILWSDSRPVDEEREGEDGGSQRKTEREREKKREGEIPHLTSCHKQFSVAQLQSEVSRNALPH